MNLHATNGINIHGHTQTKWLGRDNESNFNRLSESHKKIWGNVEIIYEINSYGFRGSWTKESVETMGDYVLVLGSSETFGQGLPVDSIWHSVIQRKINIPIINLGSPGLSIDASLYNLIEWLDNINNKPKHIVWSWSNPTRYFFVDDNKKQLSVYVQNIESLKNSLSIETCYTLSNFLLDYNIQMSELIKIKHITKLIYPKLKIFRIFDDSENYNYIKLDIPNFSPLKLFNYSNDAHLLPKARDGEHWGVESHRLLGEAVFNEFF
jgi:hypothetical protein